MKTSTLIHSIAQEIKQELRSNTVARPNYAVIERLRMLSVDLGRVSQRAEKTSEHLIHVADHFYSDSVQSKQPENAPALHREMIHVANQIEGVAKSYAASGD